VPNRVPERGHGDCDHGDHEREVARPRGTNELDDPAIMLTFPAKVTLALREADRAVAPEERGSC
jgi:hypothetical protein